MGETLEVEIRSRAAIRRDFTKICNRIESLLKERKEIDDIEIQMKLIEDRCESLSSKNKIIYELMLQNEYGDTELDNELDKVNEYSVTYYRIKKKVDRLVGASNPNEDDAKSQVSSASYNSLSDTKRCSYKLPKLSFKEYNGSLKDWLSFWAQFKKIDGDKDMDPDEKVQYLVMATAPDSPAREVVQSYPETGEMYPEIIKALKDRFGRDDLLTEYYIRELLSIILQNTVSSNKMSLSALYDKLQCHLRNLNTLGVTSENCAPILLPLVSSCLPEDILKLWERTLAVTRVEQKEDTSRGKLEKLLSFLRREVEGDQKVALAVKGFDMSPPSQNKVVKKKEASLLSPIPTATALVASARDKNPKGCLFCGGNHQPQDCIRAQDMSIEERKQMLIEKRVCFSCLVCGHSAKFCRRKPKCLICGKCHFVLLCDQVKGQEIASETTPPAIPIVESLANLNDSIRVMLQTVKVFIINGKHKKVVRALIDSASQRSYILASTAKDMKYSPLRQEALCHAVFGGKSTGVINHDVFTVYLTSLDHSYSCKFDVLDQKEICGSIVPVEEGPWIQELLSENVTLSDVGGGGPIEVLIGADIAGKLLTGNRKLLDSGLVAIETRLGWTLMGKVRSQEEKTGIAMVTTSMLVHDLKISDLWTLDVLGIQDPLEQKSIEEAQKEVEKYFLDTTVIDENQRYVVRLPWVEGHPPLQDNYDLCLQRLNTTIKRLNREQIVDAYERVFHEWLKEGIIEEVPSSEVSRPCHYLPHRHVLKENSTTKIRPVFDASAHEKGAPALNECLDKGLNLIEQIPSVLIRFRANRVGVSADIRRAFLQIKVHDSDKDFLRFIWRCADGDVKHFRHCRVVFGVVCSPFLLGATLQHLLTYSDLCLKSEFHETTERLKNSFYVDNCLTSFPNAEDAQAFKDQAEQIMKQRKFDLRGWEFSHSQEDKLCQVLGLSWNTKSDTLGLCAEHLDFTVERITKKVMLSITNQVFDPIGFTSPVVLFPKLLLQRTWEKKLSWEEEVDNETKQHFLRWLNELSYLCDIRIPRSLNNIAGPVLSRSLHVFCDASKAAYAAVVFLRVETEKEVTVNLIQAKSRVAPLKKQSIPRLELLAALIGARLYAKIAIEFGNGLTQSVFWSDSTTVLAWLHRQEQWGTFVANRVKEIVNLTGGNAWRHVPGNDNPADLPSRGCHGRKLLESRWWEGPEWLRGPTGCWPFKEYQENEDEIATEKRKSVISTMLTLEANDWYYHHFSKYQQIVRMVAWIYRFVYNASRKLGEVKRSGELSVSEYEDAELVVLKLVQNGSFEGVGDKSISSLYPFVEEDGVIRLRSKIAEREGESKDFRYPILLPAQHPVVRRLIFSKHIEACHVGTQGLLSMLREKYWILGGRRTVRSVVKSCTTCRRHEAKPLQTGPVALPPQRVRDASAFEVCGVDLAGPLYLKDGRKAWICLFTCATYRAVHLELVTSLSTDSFMLGFRRFVARRGRPSVIYSDNGLNFVGAENSFKSLDWNAIVQMSSIQRIEWRFNPPSAPWWGGWWERMVGLVKRLLRKVLQRAVLNYEELVTALCDCEAVVNSRPITYLSESPDELTPLTPSMFIQDIREVGVPECDLVEAGDLRRRLRYRQRIYEDLRKRFRLEYLGLLKQYYKKYEARQLEVGEVVLIGNDNSKRIAWPLGCITELIPGRDGVVRLVRLRTSTGQLLRPVQRLYPLEVKSTEDSTKQNESSVNGERECGVSDGEVEDAKAFKARFTKCGRKVKPINRLDL